MGPLGSPLTCRPLRALQKMLMKQQDRLEEREQDIEEQLYKLESDKRLVEVRGAHPGRVGVLGWAAGLELLGVEEPVLLYPLSPFRPWQEYFWGKKGVWGCPQLSTAVPGPPASSQVGGKGLEVQIPINP